MTKDDFAKYVNRRTTSSKKGWIVIPTDNGHEIVMDHIIAIRRNFELAPRNIVEPEIIPEIIQEKPQYQPSEPEPVHPEIIPEYPIEDPKPTQPKPTEDEQMAGRDKTEQDILKIMMERSSCTHKEEDAVLTKQATNRGERFFNVCGFCGHRGRYIKKDTLKEIDMINAKEWQER